MKKLSTIVAGLVLVSGASATGTHQSVSTSGFNSGSVNNTVKATASVSGNGLSVSGATSSAFANSTVTITGAKSSTTQNCVTNVGGNGSVVANTATVSQALHLIFLAGLVQQGLHLQLRMAQHLVKVRFLIAPQGKHLILKVLVLIQ